MTETKTKDLETIKKLTYKLLDLLGLKGYKTKITKDKDSIVHIDIDYDNPGILIGSRGETISSLQLILSLIVFKKLGLWQRLLVNVGDYRQKRQETLTKMALSIVERVKNSREEAIMPYLSAQERRIIHMALADHPDVITASRGEASERRLVIIPKGKDKAQDKEEKTEDKK